MLKNPYQGKRVLVTGGTGFIGSHLVHGLAVSGAFVVVLCDKGASQGRLDDLGTAVAIEVLDEWNVAVLERVLERTRPEIIFHARANIQPNPTLGSDDDFLRVNVTDTEVLTGAGRSLELQSFVFFGTIAEYGGSPAPFREDGPALPISAYGQSKVLTTQRLLGMWKRERFPARIVRLSLAYGPGQHMHASLIPRVIAHCFAKKDFYFPTAGEQTRDPIFVEDAVRGVLLAGTTESANGEIINIGLGKEYSVRMIAERINTLLGNPIRIFTGEVENRAGENDHYWLDIGKAERLLSWKPQVSLDEGLARTIAWYQDHTDILNLEKV